MVKNNDFSRYESTSKVSKYYRRRSFHHQNCRPIRKPNEEKVTKVGKTDQNNYSNDRVRLLPHSI